MRKQEEVKDIIEKINNLDLIIIKNENIIII